MMKKERIPNFPKRDHTVAVPNFFGEGENLEVWQLGWNLDSKREVKSYDSKKIFNFYVCEFRRNMVFYYVGDGNFYGIHSEAHPTPVFLFRKDLEEPITFNQFEGDTHDYEEDLVLYWFEDRELIWDTVKIEGKHLEEVLEQSYILVS